jgi:hypothetical protein
VTTAITMDPNELDNAAGALRGIFATLEGSARDLDGAGVAVEMPGALAARVATEVSSIAAALRRAADSLADMPGDLARRAQLGRLADTIGRLYSGAIGASLPAGIIAAQYARELQQVAAGTLPARAVSVGASAGELAKKAAAGFKGAGYAMSAAGIGLKTYDDVRNPYLDNSRRAANLAARTAVESGKVWAGAAAAGGAAALGAPVVVPVLVGVGVGIGLSVIDSKFGVTDFVADRADDVIDVGVDAVEDVTDDLGDALDFAEKGLGGIL